MLMIELSPQLEKRLDALMKKTGRSSDDIVKEALERNLEDMEDYYLALERLEEHKENGGKNYSLEEVAKELGLSSD